MSPSDDRIVRVRAIRACTSCRSRKIRCDQVRPSCGSCTRGNIHCEFPSQARRPARPRQPDAMLVERLARLESVIEQLGAVKAVRGESEESGSTSTDGLSPRKSSESDGLSATSPMSPNALEEVEAGLGRLLVSDGKSRYIGPNFWALLSEESFQMLRVQAADLNYLLHETQEDEERPDPPHGPTAGPPSFFFRHIPENLSMFYLPIEISQQLYSTFLYAVDPLIRILHKPTFHRQFEQFHSYGPGTVSKELEALVFAIYFAAITSMPPEQVVAVFGSDKVTVQRRYEVAVEHALSNARFLQSEELMPLQAFVLFNTCFRGGKDTRTSWTLVGLAVRIAQSLGLHRDGSLFSMPPFETEIRRRIWYEICVLDFRTAEDHGCDPTITPHSYDTRMPLNINDDDLSDDPNAPPPVSRAGFTEMTFCLLRFEILDCFGFLFHTMPGAAKCTRMEKETLQQKKQKIESTRVAIREKYLERIDENQPMQKLTYTVFNLLMCKARLSLYHPLRHFKDGEFLSKELKEELFMTAVEFIEYGFSFASNSRLHGYNQWNWFFQNNGHPYPLVLVLLELNEMPVFNPDGLYARAWKAVDNYFNKDLWPIGKPVLSDKAYCLWKPLAKLRDKAMKRRIRAMAATGLGDEIGGAENNGTVLGMEGGVDPTLMAIEDSPPFDWNEWDNMFERIDFE